MIIGDRKNKSLDRYASSDQEVKLLSSLLRYLLDFPKNHASTRKDLIHIQM